MEHDPITLYRGDNEVQEFYEDGPGSVLIFRNRGESKWIVMMGSPLRLYECHHADGTVTVEQFDNAQAAMRQLADVHGLAFTVSADTEWRTPEPVETMPGVNRFRDMELVTLA
jgi:hypothetical protein